MKRTGNLYSQITSMENLYLAHRNASKGKGWLKHCDGHRLTVKYLGKAA